MKKIIMYICLASLSILSCTPTKTAMYKPYKEQVEAINKMRLYAAYLVPVDSMGQYMYEEVIFSGMYDHCELIANTNNRVSILATLYFDHMGKVRKTIQYWTDGGDLNNVVYYDEQGNIIYAVYAYGNDNHGKLYSHDSKLHIEHSFSQSDYNHRIILPILATTTEDFAIEYKVHLQMPDSCNAVSFMPIQKGDMAFLCTNSIYTSPEKNKISSEEALWGRLVYIDSIANDWYRVRIPTFDHPIGYVPADSIEIKQKHPALHY